MRRRRFLGTVGVSLIVGNAGCVGGGADTGGSGSGSGSGTPPSPEPASTPAGTASTLSAGTVRNVDLPLDGTDLARAAAKDEIPAIVDPAFGEDWSAVTATLEDGDRVVGVAVDGEARAYPLPVLNWHEVVNDTFGGPLLVTYCPLCGSGVVAERRVGGRETGFGVSGYLWQRDLVLYDDLTGSLWSQILARAVRGPRTGDALALRPSALTTWGEWRRAHPDTSVLVPPPESGTVSPTGERNYNTDPYSDYEDYQPPDVSGGAATPRLPAKSLVLGVATAEAARAYPFRAVVEAGGVVNDRVGDLPVVVANTRQSLVAYVRRVDGETLPFARDGDVLAAGGSRWSVVSGRALDGPHERASLRRANDRSPMFWFAWAEFFPGTDVYGESM